MSLVADHLEPFDPHQLCPKCGHDRIHTSYEPNTAHFGCPTGARFGTSHGGEHLVRRCLLCHHVWEQRCIDPEADPPAGAPVKLREDGLLWLVNKAVLHPRGFALGVAEDGGLWLLGDGSEPWRMGDVVPEDDLFAKVEAMFDRARETNGQQATPRARTPQAEEGDEEAPAGGDLASLETVPASGR